MSMHFMLVGERGVIVTTSSMLGLDGSLLAYGTSKGKLRDTHEPYLDPSTHILYLESWCRGSYIANGSGAC